MKNVKLLDCTLRDGGFVNDWEFGHDAIINIFERLVSSKLDVIEIGFLDQRREFDINRTIMPNGQAVEKIYGGLDKGDAMVVGMIDYGTCDVDKLLPCKDSFMDGIRVIFKKHKMNEAIAFCKEVIDLGYELFVQPVSITSYSDEEMMTLIDMVNEIKPNSMSIVDTYGLMHRTNLLRYFKLFQDHLSKDIGIGYHSHNNFQLGYANAIELIETPLDHTLTVDASLFGMGKGAGNTAIELLVMYMNDNHGTDYDLNQLLELIDVNIMDMYRKKQWGYSLQYFLAASNDCHPTYVKDLIEKRTLSIKSINNILQQIQEPHKLLYNSDHLEQLYTDYQRRYNDDKKDLEGLKEKLQGRPILLLGPGSSINKQETMIQEYIEKENPIVIAINFIPKNIETDYTFITNAKRYVQLSNSLQRNNSKLIATTNVTKTKGNFDFALNYSSLLDESGVFPDNSLLMLLKVLKKIGIKKVSLAGFDGYVPSNNYYIPSMEYTFDEDLAKAVNQNVIDFIANLAPNMSIQFITNSIYNKEKTA